MAFFVKQSVAFPLLILLLCTCCSHANDHLPQVRKGDRKLVSLFPNEFRVGKSLEHIPNEVRNVENSVDHAITYDANHERQTQVTETRTGGLGSTGSWSRDQHPSVTSNLHDTNYNNNNNNNPDRRRSSMPENVRKDIERLQEWIKWNMDFEDDHEVTEAVAEKIGETVAKKLFRAHGKRGFRLGWKLGKWIYKVNEKCAKFENLFNVTCHDSTLQNTPDYIPKLSCVLLVAAKTGNVNCNEGIVEHPGIASIAPCYFNQTTIFKLIGQFAVTIQNPQKDCSVD